VVARLKGLERMIAYAIPSKVQR